MTTAELARLTDQMDLAGVFHRYAPQDGALYVAVREPYHRWLTAELATELMLHVSKTDFPDVLKVA